MVSRKQLLGLLVCAAIASASAGLARSDSSAPSAPPATASVSDSSTATNAAAPAAPAAPVAPTVTTVTADTTTIADSTSAGVTTVTTVTTVTRVAPAPPSPAPAADSTAAPAEPAEPATLAALPVPVPAIPSIPAAPEAAAVVPAAVSASVSAGHLLASTAPGASDPRIALISNGADPAMLSTLQHVLEEMGARVVVLPYTPGATPAAAPAGTVAASTSAASTAPAAAAIALSPITWEGQLRYRYENRTLLDYRLPGTFGRAATQTLTDRGDVSVMRTRVGATLKLAPGVRGFFSLQDARTMGAEGSPGGSLANVDLFNAWVDMDSLGRNPLHLRLGRQVLQYGEGRVLAGADWGNAGRGYDGARLRWAPAKLQVDGFVAWINEGRLNGQDRVLSGVDALWRPSKSAEAELYAFHRSFGDAGWTGETGAKGSLKDLTSGARTRVQRGQFELRAEGAVQSGERARDDVQSWFAVGRLTAELRNAWKTRLFVERMHASGDEDPVDGTFGRFDPVYWGGHNFQGALDVAAASNLDDLAGGFTAVPRKGWTLQGEYHVFTLADEHDVWTDDAGTTLRRNAAGLAGTQLGRELDVTARWDTRSKVSVLAGASRFWTGDYVRATGGGSDINWGFLQFAVSF